MKNIIFICPYFGNLPYEQTMLFLKSCSYNRNIDWLIITDDHTNFDLPQNVKIIYSTLEELKSRIQYLFDFKISLDNAYKLCDYKPTYGYIFSDYIKGYKFWGHCDISDSIFGNLEKFLDVRLLAKYDKIGFWGHMTLYKNSTTINKRFFEKTISNVDLKDILGVSKNMAFDEIYDYSINRLYLEKKYPLFRVDEIYFDASPKYHSFRCSIWDENFNFQGFRKEKCIIEWNNGSLYKIFINNNQICKTEIGYFHYQKRKMSYDIDINLSEKFMIVPNKFIVPPDNIDVDFIKKHTYEPIVNLDFLYLKIKYYIKKIIK